MNSVQETSRSHANKPTGAAAAASNSTKVNYVPYKNRAANEKYKEHQVRNRETLSQNHAIKKTLFPILIKKLICFCLLNVCKLN